MFHRHRWIVKEKQVLDSPYQQMGVSGSTLKEILPWVFKQVIVCYYVCVDCPAEKVVRV